MADSGWQWCPADRLGNTRLSLHLVTTQLTSFYCEPTPPTPTRPHQRSPVMTVICLQSKNYQGYCDGRTSIARLYYSNEEAVRIFLVFARFIFYFDLKWPESGQVTCEAMLGLGNEKVNSTLLWRLNKGAKEGLGTAKQRNCRSSRICIFAADHGVKLLTSARGE